MKNTPFSLDVINIDKVSSTFSAMRDLLAKIALPEGTLLFAREQYDGRGQQGNGWEAEPDKNLTFTLLLRPNGLKANRQFVLSQIVSVAIIEFLRPYGDGFSIKWPNDIYWKDQKIAGILIENDLIGDELFLSLVGVGININQVDFSASLPNPISLRQITGESYELKPLLQKLGELIAARYQASYTPEGAYMVHQFYSNALYRKDGFYTFSSANGDFEATIDSIMPSGRIVLRLKDGEKRNYTFKEVAFK